MTRHDCWADPVISVPLQAVRGIRATVDLSGLGENQDEEEFESSRSALICDAERGDDDKLKYELHRFLRGIWVLTECKLEDYKLEEMESTKLVDYRLCLFLCMY